MTETEFDWDNISIGEPGLNTSGSYFFRHVDEMEGEQPELDCGASGSSSLEQSSENDNESGNSGQITQRNRQQRQQTKARQEETCDRAYRYAKVYEEKRRILREKEQKQLEEGMKFHARPAPNFKQTGEHRKKENAEPKFTVPLTPKQMKPERLKKSADLAQKMQSRTKDPEPEKFKAHDAKVLKEKPFKPALTKAVIKPEPFNLRMSERIRERKLFDEQLQKAKEEKARREAEERRAAEERDLKLIRKQKEFKANPNPFK
ncbi:trichohyalin-like [Toxorhynchites rutilus septentrionalis]|uniref:trichohyalin-like n=1 Tax=Toxorhynchites rutilus septentrionalis TaxID=329112 RepID=UPI00247854A2|nr:trichohyalin-like [Toxorhynchites rutilus septentrionalis]